MLKELKEEEKKNTCKKVLILYIKLNLSPNKSYKLIQYSLIKLIKPQFMSLSSTLTYHYIPHSHFTTSRGERGKDYQKHFFSHYFEKPK